VPRKAIFEMSKMLASVPEETVKITLTQNHLHLVGSVFVLVTKLIDLKYPDYHKVIPRGAHLFMRVKKEIIKTVLLRVSILSNEKFRGVHFNTEENLLKVFANNPEHEEAEEKIAVNYPYKESLQIGFNVGYLLDAINSYSEGELLFSFTNADSSVLIEQEKDPFKALHVIMPMLL
jgi:DNA polymerase-3 subunit beta